jgi:N-sulfoglucosamine sulfohydrolase
VPRPNIIFLHSHNTGRFVQPYGFAVPTPNLQRLAEQGVVFRRAFAAAPTCSPSRASFLTGLCPHSAGMLGLSHLGFGRDDCPQHISYRLKAAGYFTAHCGIEHIQPHENWATTFKAYDLSLGRERDRAEVAGPTVAEFLKGKPRQPFFLSVGLRETHTPFPPPDPKNHPAEDERFCMPPRPLPDAHATRRDTAGFKASARAMDTAYGQILDAIKSAGMTENTLVCCFSDHGLQFPLNMCNLTDHGLGVYLVMRGPGGFTGGKIVDAMVSLMDLVPTACELAGIGNVEPVHGRSLLPLVRGETMSLHEELFGEVTFHAAYEPQRSVRTERYKYIRRWDQRSQLVLPNTDDCLSRQFLIDHGWREQPRYQEMLFDLLDDPTETNNLIDSPSMAAIRAEMRGRLDRWMRGTNDPLLAGHVAAPSGAQLFNVDGWSTAEARQIVP